MDEQFRTVRIRKEDRELFQDLDPFERLRLLSMPCGFAIGVLTGEGEETEKAGLLIATLGLEMLTVEWMVVDPRFRFQGVGEQLLLDLFQMAEKGGMKTLGVVLQPEYVKEVFLQGADQYFKERLFETELSVGGDLDCQVVDFVDSDFARREIPLPANARSFFELKSTQKKEYIDRLKQIDNATFFYDPEIFTGCLEKELSFVVENGNSIDAALLVAKDEDFLFPVYFYEKSEGAGDGLISASIRNALKRYGNGMGVYITMRQEETKALVERVLPNQPKARFLVSSVSDYSDMMKETE